MKKEIIDIIKEKVAHAKSIDGAWIEYNFKLPKDENIKKDYFFGVKAVLNSNMIKGTANVIWKM